MPIDINGIRQENKELKLEEKNKQKSGIPKPALYTGLSILGLTLSGIAGKVIWDKLKENNDSNPDQRQNNQFKNDDNFTQSKQIDEFKGWYDHDVNIDDYDVGSDGFNNWPVKKGDVTLSPAFQRWICENIVVLAQDHPFCWHNASWLFLLLPEIRLGEEEYRKEFGGDYPKKIKNMINIGNSWIDSYRKNKIKINDYFDDFSKKVKINVDRKTREMPDGSENEITEPNPRGYFFLFFTSTSLYNSFEREFNGIRFTERIVNLGLGRLLGCDLQGNPKDGSTISDDGIKYEHIDYLIDLVANKYKGFTIGYTKPMLLTNIGHALWYPNKFGFKPTFITVCNVGHYFTFFVLYDSKGDIANYILYDGGKLQIFGPSRGYDALLSKIGYKAFGIDTNTSFFVRYSPDNIVKKYYTPELMFNANK